MICVLAIDLDGTLLRSDQSISPKMIQILRRCQERGKSIVFASARPARKMIKFSPEEFHGLPWICYNGAEIYEGKKKKKELLELRLFQPLMKSLWNRQKM